MFARYAIARFRSQLQYRVIVTKVQPIFRLLLIGAAMLGWGCSDPEAADDAPSGRFGSPYEIVTNVTPTAPDEPPAIISDSLTLMVAYPGGCEDHAFELATSVTQDSAAIWLRHDAAGDACDARIDDRIAFAVPPRVLEIPNVYLINPSGDAPFLLRWETSAP